MLRNEDPQFEKFMNKALVKAMASGEDEFDDGAMLGCFMRDGMDLALRARKKPTAIMMGNKQRNPRER